MFELLIRQRVARSGHDNCKAVRRYFCILSGVRHLLKLTEKMLLPLLGRWSNGHSSGQQGFFRFPNRMFAKMKNRSSEDGVSSAVYGAAN